MGKKLYCGNLSYNTSSSDLEQLFSEFGQVQSAEVIMDRDTGRSKGFGFVEMSTDAEAEAADWRFAHGPRISAGWASANDRPAD